MPDPRPSRQIYAVIAERIQNGTYAPGDRVHIGLLAEEFSVTRTTVSKAMKLADAAGLVEFYTGVGWYVKEPPVIT